MELLTLDVAVSLTCLPAPGILFLLVALLLWCEGVCFVLLYFFVLFGCCLWDACSFLKGDREGVDPEKRGGGGELVGVEGGETVVGIYYRREESTLK